MSLVEFSILAIFSPNFQNWWQNCQKDVRLIGSVRCLNYKRILTYTKVESGPHITCQHHCVGLRLVF